MQNLGNQKFASQIFDEFLILNCLPRRIAKQFVQGHFEICILHFEFERAPSGSEARAIGRGAFLAL